MNASTTITAPSSLTLQKADRVGVAASILCAIHCGLAPILMILLPTFGRVWAHPASHILVAIFVVPLAIFSIRKGYRAHRKRWILVTASIGILLVLIGAMLPAFSKSGNSLKTAAVEASAGTAAEDASITPAVPCEGECTEGECAEGECAEGECAEGECAEGECAEGECSLAVDKNDSAPAAGCVDNCCPSLQVNEAGDTSLHIPPAAIVTTLGGLFLITAHIGNLCSCGHACRASQCPDCA